MLYLSLYHPSHPSPLLHPSTDFNSSALILSTQMASCENYKQFPMCAIQFMHSGLYVFGCNGFGEASASRVEYRICTAAAVVTWDGSRPERG